MAKQPTRSSKPPVGPSDPVARHQLEAVRRVFTKLDFGYEERFEPRSDTTFFHIDTGVGELEDVRVLHQPGLLSLHARFGVRPRPEHRLELECFAARLNACLLHGCVVITNEQRVCYRVSVSYAHVAELEESYVAGLVSYAIEMIESIDLPLILIAQSNPADAAIDKVLELEEVNVVPPATAKKVPGRRAKACGSFGSSIPTLDDLGDAPRASLLTLREPTELVGRHLRVTNRPSPSCSGLDPDPRRPAMSSWKGLAPTRRARPSSSAFFPDLPRPPPCSPTLVPDLPRPPPCSPPCSRPQQRPEPALSPRSALLTQPLCPPSFFASVHFFLRFDATPHASGRGIARKGWSTFRTSTPTCRATTRSSSPPHPRPLSRTSIRP